MMDSKFFTLDLYQQQLSDKAQHINQIMQPYSLPPMALFQSPFLHYRMRVEFRIWHHGYDMHYLFFDPHTKQKIRINQFPIAAQLINKIMPLVIDFLKNNAVLREKLFQIDYLVTVSNKALISLIYHKKLKDNWPEEAVKLKTHLQQQHFDLHIIGRASGQKICLDVDYIDEVLPVAGQSLIYRQIENCFTQPNATINIKMLEWAIDVTQNSEGDLLELYCGNGNFSLALSRNFRRVLATEIAKQSVVAAQYNIEVNQLDNVRIVRLSAEELTLALQGRRIFKRLKGIPLFDYQCNTVLVDPPRSGLSDNVLSIVKNYPKIIYISCNPHTLKNNLETLTKTHKITHFALFDQFPFTEHIECGMVLEQC